MKENKYEFVSSEQCPINSFNGTIFSTLKGYQKYQNTGDIVLFAHRRQFLAPLDTAFARPTEVGVQVGLAHGQVVRVSH